MSAPTKPLIDPKDLTPAVLGAALGVGIIVFFVMLATGMGLTLFVDHGNIPHQ